MAASGHDKHASAAASLPELQSIVDAATGGFLRLRDPAWITRFRLHHRQTRHYRAGPMFLAGDAAHIHSPVGAQGMNTGIPDAWNLGWKIALVAQGAARAELLDSYATERWPVGRFLLRVTDRVFTVVTRAVTAGSAMAWVRRTIVPRILSRVVTSRRLRTVGFRFVSELDIRYRFSPIVREGEPHLRGGPRAGDRFPDARVTYEGREVHLLQALAGPSMHLVLCGPSQVWDEHLRARSIERGPPLVRIHRLTRETTPAALVDETGDAFKRLAVAEVAQYLIRPDGYIAYRCAGAELAGVFDYLVYCFPGAFGANASTVQPSRNVSPESMSDGR